LLIRGTESWASDPEEDGRIEPFQNATVAAIEGAGHWAHHDRLDVFLDLVRKHMAK
jgi:pimeloyl-ACP methyl ester carboxylesterase